jgi:hypothetical protein
MLPELGEQPISPEIDDGGLDETDDPLVIDGEIAESELPLGDE